MLVALLMSHCCRLPEEEEVFPMRDKEDHVGAVAFMKVRL